MEIAIIVLLILVVITLGVSVGFISYFLYTKTEYVRSQQFLVLEDVKQRNHQTPQTLEKRIDATNKFLDMVDNLVDTEIVYLIQSRDLLNKKYDFKLSEDDIRSISGKIVSSINTNVWDSVDMVINAEYLMDYVISRVSMMLFKTAKDYNDRVRNG